MFFIVDPYGKKVATATAFFDEKLPGGWLHWVSVSRDAQGKGLSRPLIAHTLHRLQALGYKELFVPTQTTTWVAAKLYLDFGSRAGEFGRRSFRLAHAENADRPPGIKRAGTRRG